MAYMTVHDYDVLIRMMERELNKVKMERKLLIENDRLKAKELKENRKELKEETAIKSLKELKKDIES